MAKKGSKDSTSLIKKGITLVASVLTFIFLFLEILAVKVSGKNILTGKTETESDGVKFMDLLFNEDYETVREELSLTNIILWVVFILVIVAMVVSALGFVMKKGSNLSKLGGVLLVVAMVALFVVNFDKTESGILKITSWVSNFTALYFVSLVTSVVGLGSALTLKK